MSAASPSSISGSLSSSLTVPSSILTAAASPTPPPQRPDGPAPSDTAGNGGGGTGGNQNSFGPPPQLTSSASLYLYTFLATIVLLLLVSITIIARSYALRRRQQALIAEAIANGTYIPPKKPGDVGEKPKMYEIFIGDGEGAQEEVARGGEPPSEKEKEKEKEEELERLEDGLAVDWDKIMPVACRWLNAPESSQSPAGTTTSNGGPSPPSSPASTSRRLSRFSLSSFSGLRMQARSPVPPPSVSEYTTSPSISPTATDRPDTRFSLLSSSAEKPPQTPEPAEEKVRVSVLISMPFADPSRKRKSMASALTAISTSTSASAAASEVPYVELGTTEVSAGSLRSSLEVPPAQAFFPIPDSGSGSAGPATRNSTADWGERRAGPAVTAASYMNV